MPAYKMFTMHSVQQRLFYATPNAVKANVELQEGNSKTAMQLFKRKKDFYLLSHAIRLAVIVQYTP